MTRLYPHKSPLHAVLFVPVDGDPHDLLHNDCTEMNVTGTKFNLARYLIPLHVGVSYGVAQPSWGSMSEAWALKLWWEGKTCPEGMDRLGRLVSWYWERETETRLNAISLARYAEKQGRGKLVCLPELSELEMLALMKEEQ